MQTNFLRSVMINGLILGTLFSVNFLMSASGLAFMSLLSLVLMVVIIAVMYKLTVRFRDTESNNVISYRVSFSYILLSFFFASLISSAVKFVFFKYIQPDYLEQAMEQSFQLLETMKMPNMDEALEQMDKMMKPANMALQFIWLNTFMGTVVALVMSAFVKKEKSIFE